MPQNRPETGGRAGTFRKGQSGNPGGRPKGLASYAREIAGDDGKKLADFWLDVMEDEDAPLRLRLEASRLLADRAYGKPVQTLEHQTPDGTPFPLRLDLGALTDADLTALERLVEKARPG